ncbi:homeobox protein engrailed-2-like [Physeter macrocephalus]|uniref:Homeobox protein engrailed-2-like n=1 Tax=Physeter macrocephalus TaxID=9755 RepID=A0A455BC13_PHYMC|nr:homeobox protein engrailed-2-like [Physeter catodon]|eukprot:XP_028346249.1 homeobox protein engrailed-2-like [Physeter catodon]
MGLGGPPPGRARGGDGGSGARRLRRGRRRLLRALGLLRPPHPSGSPGKESGEGGARRARSGSLCSGGGGKPCALRCRFLLALLLRRVPLSAALAPEGRRGGEGRGRAEGSEESGEGRRGSVRLWPLSSIHNKAEPPAAAAAAATIAPWLARGSRGALTVHRAGSCACPPAGLFQRSGFVYESSGGDTQGSGNWDPGRRRVAAEARISGHWEAARAADRKGPQRMHNTSQCPEAADSTTSTLTVWQVIQGVQQGDPEDPMHPWERISVLSQAISRPEPPGSFAQVYVVFHVEDFIRAASPLCD